MSPTTWFRAVGVSALLLVVLLLPSPGDEAKGKKYALLVGVTEYKNDNFPTLKYTANDVEKLAPILEKAGFSVRLMTNAAKKDADKPTAANIKDAIDAIVTDRDRRDTVLVALSGHGANVEVEDPDEKGKPKTYAYFCPQDASLLGPSYSTGKSKFLVNLKVDLFDKLKHCGARSKLVLVDACRNEFKAENAARDLGVDEESIPGGVGVLFSCSKGERAWESKQLEHGVFFHFVLEGLRGKAKNEDGEVTWHDLVAYSTRQVERRLGDYVKGSATQTPHTLGNARGAVVLIPAGKVVPEVSKDKEKDGGKVAVQVKDGFTNSVGMKFVGVKAGKFLMGSPKAEAERSNDEEQHEVELTEDFYVGVHEVTQGQWKAVLGKDNNPSSYKNGDTFPAETVSWQDAQDFLAALTKLEAEKKSRREYRLPTEAEWEYACRGGHLIKEIGVKATLPFHFEAPTDKLSSKQANFDGRFPYGGAPKGDFLQKPSAVGKYEPNALGIYDMHGNVWEWCQDWYGENTYGEKNRKNPKGPDKGAYRVLRGGSWVTTNGHTCRAARRHNVDPGNRGDYGGFRAVCVVRRD